MFSLSKRSGAAIVRSNEPIGARLVHSLTHLRTKSAAFDCGCKPGDLEEVK